ncbi:MAG: hypothetical protein ACO1QS_09000 [Verrucomicrobiota bacterium]
MNRWWCFWLLVFSCLLSMRAAELPLPQRPADALKGSEIVQRISGLDLPTREQFIKEQVLRGNVPDFWRRFAEVKFTRKIGTEEHQISYRAAPDYLAVGSDADYFLAPISPRLAQTIADSLACVLPTRQMVNDIYAAAPLKLAPAPIPPSNLMTTVPVFLQHNQKVFEQRQSMLPLHPLGVLVAGHKKDVVLTPRSASAADKVAIYGWHQSNGKPIQPLYLGHTASWVDYSHGVRFIQRQLTVDGKVTTVEAILADPELAVLLSDEGPLLEPRYGFVRALPQSEPAVKIVSSAEATTTLTFDPGVRVVINSPANLDTNKPVRLVLYALPNGNTIEQTIGRKLKPGDDWHFDIQHIGAQTRWLRARLPDVNLVVAYLENSDKSWPTWRRKNDADSKRIMAIVQELRERYPAKTTRLVLTGHSGGGSFTFGYLNGLERIPDDVERIAFLDSNYAYDAALGHADKLAVWLAGDTKRYLCVLAYHDSVALLNGKTFVSEAGGTWGRSQAMLRDLGVKFPFKTEITREWQRHQALDGRAKFFMKENPTKAVLHTRQVEWNGFIHAMLTGTELEGKGYEYMNGRVYSDLIQSE